MSDQISSEFLKRIGDETLNILRQHEVPKELEYSITSALLFNFATAIDDGEFVDERKLLIDDGLHEIVDAFCEDWYDPEKCDNPPHRIIFDIKIARERGKVAESNFIAHWIEMPDLFTENLEVLMGCRTLNEIDKRIPELIVERFEQRNKRFGGVKEIQIRLPENDGTDKWEIISFPDNSYGNYNNTLISLSKCIIDIAKNKA